MRRVLTDQERTTFERDGVVHVPGAITEPWVERMLAAVDAKLAEPVPPGGSPRGTGMDRHLYPTHPEFRAFVFEAGLAGLAADATGSEQIRAYFDQIFVKEAGTPRVFAWHQDHPYWPIGGTQVLSTWVALTAATVESSSLEFVRGSHLWGKTYRPYFDPSMSQADINKIWDGFGDHVMSLNEQIVPFEEYPDRYDVLGFAVEPGDAVLFDYRIVHRSRGNPTANRRVAVSWRWLGQDATWQPVRGKDPIIGPDDTPLQPGDLITDDVAFPVAFRADQVVVGHAAG